MDPSRWWAHAVLRAGVDGYRAPRGAAGRSSNALFHVGVLFCTTRDTCPSSCQVWDVPDQEPGTTPSPGAPPIWNVPDRKPETTPSSGPRSGTFPLGNLELHPPHDPGLEFQVPDRERSKPGSWGGGISRFPIGNALNLDRGGTRVPSVRKRDTQVCITSCSLWQRPRPVLEGRQRGGSRRGNLGRRDMTPLGSMTALRALSSTTIRKCFLTVYRTRPVIGRWLCRIQEWEEK